MRQFSLYDFHGLDLRRATELSDQKSARLARNLRLTNGRVWRTRPGTKRLYACPPRSRGLYAAGGVLRAVHPAQSAEAWGFQRPEFWLDFVETQGDIADFLSAEIYGVPSAATGVQPYVALRRPTGEVEHHWIRSRPVTPTSPVTTKIEPGFIPSGGILKLAQKIFTAANALGHVRFSSTAFGPENWTEEADAGFMPVQQHSTGDLQVQALSYHGNRLVVFFESQLQIWAVDPQPENFYLVEILNGPGTIDQALVQNVLGDLMFFSRGGFRTLSTQRITGELQEGDIGAQIADLTSSLNGLGTDAVWWQRLGCYLAAFGDRVFAFTFDPQNKVTGWSEWQFPFPIENFAINDNRLFARSQNSIYEISDEFDTDDGAPINWRWESQHLHLGAPDRLKQFQAMSIHQTGQSRLLMRPDPNQPGFETPVFLPPGGTTLPWQKIPLLGVSSAPALILEGSGRWQFDGLTIHFQPLGV